MKVFLSNNFNDLETTARKTSVIQERMSLVSGHMYKQFLEYQQSNANTAILFDKMVENMSVTVEYLKQSFTARGIPSENIYYEYDKQKHIAMLNILWYSIGFVSNMKDKPKALHREKDFKKKMYEILKKSFDVTLKEVKNAADAAYKEYREYRKKISDYGKEILEKANKAGKEIKKRREASRSHTLCVNFL